MRVLVIANNFPTPAEPADGIFVFRQLNALRALGHEFSVIRVVPIAPPVGRRWSRYARTPDRYAIDDIPVRTVRGLMLPRSIMLEHLPAFVHRAVATIINEVRPDLIHAHGLLHSGAIAGGHGVPSIVTAHGSDAYDLPWRRPGLRRAAATAARSVDRCIAVSAFVRDAVHALGAAADVVFNGADDAVFMPRDRMHARTELDLPTDRRIVVCAGHLEVEKGIFDLVEASATLSDLRPLVIFAGAGTRSEELQVRAKALNVDFLLLGRLDHERLALLFNAADVVAHPSHREGLPAAVCEAMLSGSAIVASAVGGIPEIIRHGQTGLLVTARDGGMLAVSIREILANRSLAEAVARSARQFALDHLTWNRNARAYDKFYQALVRPYGPIRNGASPGDRRLVPAHN